LTANACFAIHLKKCLSMTALKIKQQLIGEQHAE
jgi:hypothetical protein